MLNGGKTHTAQVWAARVPGAAPGAAPGVPRPGCRVGRDVMEIHISSVSRISVHWSITGRFTGPVTGTPPVNFLLADLLPTLLAKKITAPLLACQ